MAKEFQRTDRIAQQFQKEISNMLLRDIKDPRIGMVTITEVQVARDLSHSTVFVTTLLQSGAGHDPGLEESIEALNDSVGYMRSLLGKRLRLRTIPRFRFVFDGALDRGFKMGDLISEVSANERNLGPVEDAE